MGNWGWLIAQCLWRWKSLGRQVYNVWDGDYITSLGKLDMQRKGAGEYEWEMLNLFVRWNKREHLVVSFEHGLLNLGGWGWGFWGFVLLKKLVERKKEKKKEKEDNVNLWLNWMRTVHLDHSCKLVCEHKTNLLSKDELVNFYIDFVGSNVKREYVWDAHVA